MKAIVTTSANGGVAYLDKKKFPFDEKEVAVTILAAGINHRDKWISQGQYPGIKPNVVLGSDAVALAHSDNYTNKRVLINPNINWGKAISHQSPEYQILGTPSDGVFIEQRSFNVNRMILAPDYLSDHEAAALPLAGMTAFRALFTQGKVDRTTKVFISGGGGGVAHLAIMFARAAGAKVFTNTSTSKKQAQCEKIGAEKAFNYKDDRWLKEALASGPYDVVIDSSGGENLNNYLRLCRPGGKIVLYGSTLGKTPNFDTHRLFWSQINLLGSTMASDIEFLEMVQFVELHKIRPVIDNVFRMEDYKAAFERFMHPDHFGKIVFDLQVK